MPCWVRAGTRTQSAVWPSSTIVFDAGEPPRAGLAAGAGADAVDHVAVAVLVDRDGATRGARRERRRAGRRARGAAPPSVRQHRATTGTDPGSGSRPISSSTTIISSSPMPEPAVLLGHQQPDPAEVDELLPDLVGDPGVVVDHLPDVARRRACSARNCRAVACSACWSSSRVNSMASDAT